MISLPSWFKAHLLGIIAYTLITTALSLNGFWCGLFASAWMIAALVPPLLDLVLENTAPNPRKEWFTLKP